MPANQSGYLNQPPYQPPTRLLILLAASLLAIMGLAGGLLFAFSTAVAGWQAPFSSRLLAAIASDPVGQPFRLPQASRVRLIVVAEAAIPAIRADAAHLGLSYASLGYRPGRWGGDSFAAVLFSGADLSSAGGRLAASPVLPLKAVGPLAASPLLSYTLATDQQPTFGVEGSTTVLVALPSPMDCPLWAGLGDPPTATLLLAGPQVYPGSYPAASLIDIAPTLAVMLGKPIPDLAVGHILWQALSYPANGQQVAGGQYNLASQRLRLAAAIRRTLDQPAMPLDAQLQASLRTAGQAYAAGDYTTTISLSSSVLGRADAALAASQQDAARNALYARAILPISLLLLTGPLLWRWRSRWLGYYLPLAVSLLLLEWLVVGGLARAPELGLRQPFGNLWHSLLAALAAQVAVAIAVALLHERVQRGPRFFGSTYLPGPGQLLVWQLRQPRSARPLLWLGCYRLGLLLCAGQAILCTLLFAGYGWAAAYPAPDRLGSLALAYSLALLGCTAALNLFLSPLLASALHRFLPADRRIPATAEG